MLARTSLLGLALLLACGGEGTTTGTDSSTGSSSGEPTSTGSTSGVTTSGSSGTTAAADDSGGHLVSFTPMCKMEPDNYPTTQECFGYSYVDGNLTITHGNAALNCCVKNVIPTFEVVDNNITITLAEDPDFTPCGCGCLFNIDYQFDALPVGDYVVTVNGPYVAMGDPPLTQLLTLAMTPIGQVCVDRSGQPWG